MGRGVVETTDYMPLSEITISILNTSRFKADYRSGVNAELRAKNGKRKKCTDDR